MTKKLIFVVLLFSLFLGVKPVCAFQTRSTEEVAQQIGHYTQKLAKTAFYVETIMEGIKYVETVGRLKINAVMEFLRGGLSDMTDFQKVLNFADANSFNSLLKNDVLSNVRDAANDLNSNIDELKNTANDLKEMAQNEINDALNYTGTNEEEDEYDLEDDIADDEKEGNLSDSAASKVIVVKSNFGKPQKDKEAAERFIRKRYYYSAKEGDVYDGKPLTETDLANELVLKNRAGYFQEVLANSVATGLENLTTVKEDSYKKMKELAQKASSAESIDDKRAVEALIVQEEVRQRMLRLNLELAALEKDVVEEMQSTGTVYIIARTPTQIEQDTQDLLDEDDEEDVLLMGGEE